ncbi:LOB domain-containing protein 11 [Acorus calamus]|uniref:LOB domain-containing protein 11 n=1 Tax=Acorus calamus TaxID=4465 RepID=A0AAV9C618_ACOCL|nr:LOB domain-containing protein 11 [Acorus calamus]
MCACPYFPPTEPLKFTIAHRVFGASNIIKLLQELPESQRADAVSSMVYEANARIRDPVYGCAGAICQLQKQVMKGKSLTYSEEEMSRPWRIVGVAVDDIAKASRFRGRMFSIGTKGVEELKRWD